MLNASVTINPLKFRSFRSSSPITGDTVAGIAALSIENARNFAFLENENARLRGETLNRNMLGESPAMQAMRSAKWILTAVLGGTAVVVVLVPLILWQIHTNGVPAAPERQAPPTMTR